MQVSVRSYLTAGVAFVGAGAIALTPIQPLERTVELRAAVTHSANVALTSTQNPIQLWLDVLQTSAGNVGALGQAVLANPAPVLGQAIKNQIGYGRALFVGLEAGANEALNSLKTLPTAVRDALTYLAAGNIVDGVQALLNPVMGLGFSLLIPLQPIVETITAMAQNFANAVATVSSAQTVISLVLAIGGPILSAVNAVVEQAQDMVDGLKAGNLGNVIKAVLNIPAALVDGILNGHGNIVFSGFPLPAAGLLTPYENSIYSGIFGVIQQLRVEIGAAIKPPAPEMMSVMSGAAPEAEDADSGDVLAGAESEGTDAIEVEVVSEATETEELPTEVTETEAVTETVALEEESSADDLLAGDDEEVAEDTPKSIADEREALTGSDDEDEDAESEAGSGSTSTGGGAGGSGGLSGEADGDADGADTDAGDSGGDAGGDSGGDSGSSGGGSSE